MRYLGRHRGQKSSAGRKDPGKIVVDEVAGQLIALFPLMFVQWSMITVMVSFILFRFFDIVKALSCNRLQELKGGPELCLMISSRARMPR